MKLNSPLAALRALLLASLLACPALADEPPASPAGQPAPAQVPDQEPGKINIQGGSGLIQLDAGHDDQPVISIGDHANLRAGESAPNLVAVHGRVNCQGTVHGPAVLVDSDGEINGTIDNGLFLIMSKAHLGPKAVIHGQLTVIGIAPDIDPRAVIDSRGPNFPWGAAPFRGLLRYVTRGLLWARPFPPGVGWVWWVVATMFGVTFLVTLLFQRRVVNCANVVRDRPLACFFSGVGFRILTPLGVILMTFTLILILVLPFLFCVLIAASLLGKAAISVALGRLLVGTEEEPSREKIILSFVVGSVIIYALYMVPLLGLFVFLIVSPTVLGAAILSRFGSPRSKLVPPATPFTPPPAPLTQSALVARETAPAAPAQAAANQASPIQGLPATSLAVLQVSIPETGSPPGPATPPSPPPVPPTEPNPEPTRTTPPPIAPPPSAPRVAKSGAHTIEILACPRATFWYRIAAIILDLIIVNASVEFVFSGRFINSRFFESERGFLLIWLVYHVAMWVWKGTTLGGAVLGLKCVRTSGEPLDRQVALIRALASSISFLALGLGFFWIAWDPERQSWHDRIADTMIVKMPRAISLV